VHVLSEVLKVVPPCIHRRADEGYPDTPRVVLKRDFRYEPISGPSPFHQKKEPVRLREEGSVLKQRGPS